MTSASASLPPWIQPLAAPPPEGARGSFSYYGGTWGCLRRQTLAAEKGNEWDGGEAADFGTELHAWLESYHQGQPLPALTSEEAGIVAARYADRFAPESFGQVTHGERKLAMNVLGSDGRPWLFKGVLDASVTLSEADVARVELERKIVLPGPGRYVVDHKTKKSHPRSLVWEYGVSPQFTGYWLLSELVDGPGCLGTFVNVLFRYKELREQQFITFFIPPPDERLIEEFRYFVVAGGARREALGPDHVMPTRCFDFFRQCPALAEGCLRTGGRESR